MIGTGDRAPQREAALLVPLPVLDPVVAAHRALLDPSAVRGVPAHVTVLYPFLPSPSADDLARVAEAVGSVRRFTCALARTAWFGDDVVWVAPDPDAPFRDLTRALGEAFPDLLPYGGAIARDDLVPHATIGDRTRSTATVEQLRMAEDDVRRHLPIEATVDAVHLMTGTHEPASWATAHRFPLA